MLDTFDGARTDALTQILLGLRLEGVAYRRLRFATPWAVSFEAQDAARFHFASRGGCWLQTAEAGWLRLEPGDAVLLPRGIHHVLASAPDVPAVDIDALAHQAVAADIYLVGGAVEHPAQAQELFSGALHFNLDARHPLLALMPQVIRAGALAARDPTVPVLLEAMEREIVSDRIGACGILARMADVLAASIIRAWAECACSSPSGWFAALRSPLVGRALAAIHADPSTQWSVPALASLSGASRSRFVNAFREAVGETPARYLVKVRMYQAQQWIGRDGMRVGVAATRLGYESEAAFSRAFKHVMGHPPSVHRAPRAAFTN